MGAQGGVAIWRGFDGSNTCQHSVFCRSPASLGREWVGLGYRDDFRFPSAMLMPGPGKGGGGGGGIIVGPDSGTCTNYA